MIFEMSVMKIASIAAPIKNKINAPIKILPFNLIKLSSDFNELRANIKPVINTTSIQDNNRMSINEVHIT